jgi:ABC-type transport system substrate-binding protein
LTTDDPPFWQQGAELIKDQLAEIGVDVTIQLLDNPEVNAALKAGQPQLGYGGTPGNGPDPDSWVYPYFSSKGALNSFTHYNNPDVDKLLEQAQKLILDDAAVCVLFEATTAALSRANVHDVPLGPTPAVGASQVWKSG